MSYESKSDIGLEQTELVASSEIGLDQTELLASSSEGSIK